MKVLRTCSDSQWLGHIHRRSNKPRFQCRVDSNNNLLHVRAIQGHSGGELIAPELLNHVAIPPRWKEYLHLIGGSFTTHSIMQAGLIAGGKDTPKKDGRLSSSQLWTHWAMNPTRSTKINETTKGTIQKQVDFFSDAISWVNLGKAQDKGTQFWHTQFHAIILYNSVPGDCIEKVVPDRTRFCIKGFLLRDPLPKLCSEELGKYSTIKKCSNNQAPRNRVRTTQNRLPSARRPQKAVFEDRGRTSMIQNLAHTLRTQSRTESMITDLQKTDVFNTFSEESKRTIQSLGEIELFELGEVSSKTQCPSCAKYWPEGLLKIAPAVNA